MNVRIWWDPVPGAVRFVVAKAVSITGTYAVITEVNSLPLPETWDSDRAKFFFDDPEGTSDFFYRVDAYDAAGANVGASDPFQSQSVNVGTRSLKVRIDHDFGGADTLKTISPGGSPVTQCEVRVFRQVDWQAGRRSTPVGMTLTDNEGRWMAPVFVDGGQSYVVHFFKASGYGPDTVTVTA